MDKTKEKQIDIESEIELAVEKKLGINELCKNLCHRSKYTEEILDEYSKFIKKITNNYKLKIIEAGMSESDLPYPKEQIKNSIKLYLVHLRVVKQETKANLDFAVESYYSLAYFGNEKEAKIAKEYYLLGKRFYNNPDEKEFIIKHSKDRKAKELLEKIKRGRKIIEKMGEEAKMLGYEIIIFQEKKIPINNN